MEHTCPACEKLKPLDEHFEAIFDFLDEYELDYGDLPFARMNIHSQVKHLED